MNIALHNGQVLYATVGLFTRVMTDGLGAAAVQTPNHVSFRRGSCLSRAKKPSNLFYITIAIELKISVIKRLWRSGHDFVFERPG